MVLELEKVEADDVRDAAEQWIFSPSSRATLSAMMYSSGKGHGHEQNVEGEDKFFPSWEPEREGDLSALEGRLSNSAGSSAPSSSSVGSMLMTRPSVKSEIRFRLCQDLDSVTSLRDSLSVFRLEECNDGT